MKIVPSILADNFDDFILRLRQAESFADYVQIDLMDGIFVASVSFPVEKINSVDTSLTFEAHIMANDPLSFLGRIDHRGLKKVIFHFEAGVKHSKIINKIRERRLVPGMAIKPETEISEFRIIAEDVDTLLFLTVDPCCYGSPFKPEILKKVDESRKIFPRKVIGVDGGVSLDNLKNFFDIDVDYVCVGSRIFLHDDPKENYKLFLKKLHELETSRV